jgi:hypothetical protein
MIHSIELSKKDFALIAEQFPNKFVDVSYKNDTCDSIYSDADDMLIILPNSEVNEENKGLFNTFVLNINDQEIKGEKSTLVFNNINELITELKTILN